MQSNDSEKGYAGLIGILIVLVIMMFLTMQYFQPSPTGGPSTYTGSINKAHEAECRMNRATLRTNVAQWSIAHAGETPTVEKLQFNGITIPKCRDGGVYTFASDGTIYCSVHDPAPTPPPPPTPSAEDLFKAPPASQP
ncbi:MAG: hypothetical protein NTW86_22980 [Candidatus Sumerlaeota bacterium]|nr:hypothetical protein [Candidatus Sumerlaeota bacterium]